MSWTTDTRYTRLVQQHGSSLLRLAILLTGNRHDGEDVVQDVLIRVSAKWSPAHNLGYLRRAVANGSMDVHRRRHDVLVAVPPESAASDSGMFRLEDDEQFFARIQALPPQQRTTVVLKYHADMDDRTIATMLGVSIETVRSNNKRALEKLRVDAATKTPEEVK